MVRDEKGNHPILMGAMIVHKDCSAATYNQAFAALKAALPGDTQFQFDPWQPGVFGSDMERAFNAARRLQFPDSKTLVCYNHIRDALTRQLTDAGLSREDMEEIRDALVGPVSLFTSVNREQFQERREEVQRLCANKGARLQ